MRDFVPGNGGGNCRVSAALDAMRIDWMNKGANKVRVKASGSRSPVRTGETAQRKVMWPHLLFGLANVPEPESQLLIQRLFDCFGDEACGVHAPYMHTIFVAVGTQLHQHQVRHWYNQKILTM